MHEHTHPHALLELLLIYCCLLVAAVADGKNYGDPS